MTLAALIESEGDDQPPTATRTSTQEERRPARRSDEKQRAETTAGGQEGRRGQAGQVAGIKVVYVADIDLMIPAFLRIRARPDEQEDIRWEFENVTFLLNIIDVLASETDYIPIRKRKPRYTTLQVVEARVTEAREDEFAKSVEFQAKYDKALQDAEAENERAMQEFRRSWMI